MQVSYIDHCGSDLTVVNAARVSFDKRSSMDTEGNLKGTDEGLLEYLSKHKHFSPFNHTFITLRVKAPIFVARQLVKHEYMPWNEVSRRYVSTPPEFFNPLVWRRAAEDKKQGSSDGVVVLLGDSLNTYTESVEYALAAYESMLDQGVAPEMARMVLPQSMYTEWYWSGTLKAWAKMYKLRMGADAQEETKDIAALCGLVIAEHFPKSWEALTNAELV